MGNCDMECSSAAGLVSCRRAADPLNVDKVGFGLIFAVKPFDWSSRGGP